MLHHIHLRAYLPLLLLSTIPTMIQAGEPNERGSSQVPDRIPLIEDEPEKTSASSPIIQVKVESSQANGVGAFNAMLKSARTEYAQVNDYTAMLIRQERCTGKTAADSGGRTPFPQNAVEYQHPHRGAEGALRRRNQFQQ